LGGHSYLNHSYPWSLAIYLILLFYSLFKISLHHELILIHQLWPQEANILEISPCQFLLDTSHGTLVAQAHVVLGSAAGGSECMFMNMLLGHVDAEFQFFFAGRV
jgi:hypothetical protein